MSKNIQNVVAHLAKLAAYTLKTTPADHHLNHFSYPY